MSKKKDVIKINIKDMQCTKGHEKLFEEIFGFLNENDKSFDASTHSCEALENLKNPQKVENPLYDTL